MTTNPQTEARAIARFRVDWEHDENGQFDLVRVWSDEGPFVSYADHATALAAKDAELTVARDSRTAWKQISEEQTARAERAEAQLAEVDAHRRKVLAENERLLNGFIEKDRQLAEANRRIAEKDKALERIEATAKDKSEKTWHRI